MSEANVIGVSNSYTTSGDVIYVADVSFSTATVSQGEFPGGSNNNKEPCGPNLITITLEPDVTLYLDCNGSPAHLLITGFSGSSTADGAYDILGDTGQFFATKMTWDKSAGSVSLYLQKDLIKDTPYTFSFTLINGQTTVAGHSNITVKVPHISDTTHTLNGTVMEVVTATMVMCVCVCCVRVFVCVLKVVPDVG